jgi:hypothetical protein
MKWMLAMLAAAALAPANPPVRGAARKNAPGPGMSLIAAKSPVISNRPCRDNCKYPMTTVLNLLRKPPRLVAVTR